MLGRLWAQRTELLTILLLFLSSWAFKSSGESMQDSRASLPRLTELLIGYVHKSLKDTQSPLSPVLSLLYIFLSPVSSPLFGCWSGGLRRPHWRLKPLCCISRYATYNACTQEKGEWNEHSTPLLSPLWQCFWGTGWRGVSRAVPLNMLRRTPRTLPHPLQDAEKLSPGRGWGENEGRQELRRRDLNTSLSQTPSS